MILWLNIRKIFQLRQMQTNTCPYPEDLWSVDKKYLSQLLEMKFFEKKMEICPYKILKLTTMV